MCQNYFKIALRNLWRHKLHTIINIVGLAIGISACLSIFQIVTSETSFDIFHPDKDRIYRIYSEFSGAFSDYNGGVTAPLAQALSENATGIEVIAPFHTLYNPKAEIRNADNNWKDLTGHE